MSFPHGKVPIEVLRGIVFKNLGVRRDDVIMGPGVGEDAAVLRVGDEVLVASSDPITGAVEKVGWLAVNVSANDVATRGIKPRWYVSCILLPEGSGEDVVRKICGQIDEAARELGVAIVGGHCEATPSLTHPVVVGCMLGVADGGRYVTSSGARAGDKIILTKSAGLEGTAVLASDRRDLLVKNFGGDLVDRAEGFFRSISVVDDALIAFGMGGVSAMHDPTEGGVAGGLHEIGDASKNGFYVDERRISVREETTKICSLFDIDPLQLISSGALLISANPKRAGRIVKALLENGIEAAVIGEFTKPSKGRLIRRMDGSEEELVRPVCDHLWIALAKEL